MMVVGVEEPGKRLILAASHEYGADLGPLFEQGAVEALHLPVRLGPVGTAVVVQDPVLGQGLVEQPVRW